MKNKIFKAFCLTALFMPLTGCIKAPQSVDANEVEANKVTAVKSTKASYIDAKTRVGSNNLFEITPAETPNTTCFMLSSIYTGNAVSGAVECVDGDNSEYKNANRSLEILSNTKIDANNFYEVVPATRPDLTCFVTSTVYSGNAVSGSIKCMRNI